MGLGARGKGEIIASRARTKVANSAIRGVALIMHGGGGLGRRTRLHIKEPLALLWVRQGTRIVAAKEAVPVAGDATVEHVADGARDKSAEARQDRPRGGAPTEHVKSSVGTEQKTFVWCIAVEYDDHSVILEWVKRMATQDFDCGRTL